MLSPIKVNVNVNGNVVIVEAVPYMNISKRDVYALNNIVNHNIHGYFGLIDIRARNISVEPFRHKLIVEIAAMRTSKLEMFGKVQLWCIRIVSPDACTLSPVMMEAAA